VVVRCLSPAERTVLKVVLYIAVAGLLGFLSTLLLPDPIIRAAWLRIVYLIAAPVTLAAIMAWIGRTFLARHMRRTSLETFGFGWLFAFSFALTRFLVLA
jgi:hypothetical protein